MTRYRALPVATDYWKPKDDYLQKIIQALDGKIRDGDFVVISEKALSIATCNIVDEKGIVPSLNARFIARFWMQKIWGYYLGYLCGFGIRLVRRLREYPLDLGAKHKQLALQQAGLIQALLFGSEAGIDGSNLAYYYVSLSIKDPSIFAQKIQSQISQTLRKSVCVIVADTDKTYLFFNFYFTPRPDPLSGIHSFGGVFSYVLGRILKLKRSSTPLAVAGCTLSAGQALTITNIADRARGPGSGATVWDMAARFNVGVNEVSWEMLNCVIHKPLVIVRRVLQ